MTKKPRNPADYVIGDDVEVSDVDLKQEEVYVDGERLTDERVEQMASESLRLAREREANLIPGGKSLSGGSAHSPAVQVVVSKATHAKLKELARSRKMSVSKLLRPVLDEFVQRETGRILHGVSLCSAAARRREVWTVSCRSRDQRTSRAASPTGCACTWPGW